MMAKGLGAMRIAWLAIILAAAPVHAQGRSLAIRQFHHTAWTVKEGAPPEIWALDQGPDGFLWLGTGSGLYRFDGISFERFEPAPGERLASIDITSVKALAPNEIWIGYSDGGASRLRDGHITTFPDGDGIGPGMVVRFLEDRDGVLWALSHGGASRFIDGAWRKLGAEWGLPDEKMIELFLARNGVIWLSTLQSIYFLRPGARKFEPTGEKTLEATFTQTPDGRIWAADGLHGLRPLPDYPDGNSESPWALKDAAPGNILFVPNFAIDRQGVIWGTDRLNGGVFRHDPMKEDEPSYSLLPSDLKDVFRRADGLTADRSIPILSDREGNIWVGTNAGLNRFRHNDIVPDTAVPVTTAAGYSIAAMPDATYITDGAWLYRAAPGDTARRFVQLPEIASTLLLRSRDDALWYVNHRFSYRLHNKKLSQFPPPEGVADENIIAIAEDASGALWAAFARSGVYRLIDGVWSDKVDFGDLPAPVIAESDPAGPVWFGFSGSRVSRHDETGMRVFSARDGLEVGNVEAIVVLDGELWVGGEFGVGLLEKERFHTIGSDRVAPLFGVSGIGRTEGGDLLFNSLTGVIRMDAREARRALADTSYAPPFKVHDTREGLVGVAQQGWHAPTVVSGADGRIWFIGNTGVGYLGDDRHERNELPPPVAILSASAYGHAYPVRKRLKLPKGVSSLSIAYTAASLTAPERTRFRYRLEGLNKDWIEAGGDREAVYSNLDPGHYTFQVIASNEADVWSEKNASLEFDIPPTFFQSWPFKLLCGLALAAMLWLAYSMRLRAVANRIRMRMAERIEERERIARELHDTLLQSVQALTLRFQLAADELPQKEPARPALEAAITRADEVIAEGRDRVRNLRPVQSCDIEQIIEDIVKRQAFCASVETSVKTLGAPRGLDPMMLDEAARIAGEAIFNIWRHADATRVKIEIDHGVSFSMRFADNGVGIDPEIVERGEKEGHFGLAGMRERARRLHGELAVRRLPEGGTEVMLTVPASIAYKKRKRRIFASFGGMA